MYKFWFLPENSIGEDMEKSGITRRIDDLGRIVIPKEIRKNLKIKDSDEIEISVIDGKIVLNKYESLEKDKNISCLLYSMGRYLNKNILFTSRDKVIDAYIKNKDDYLEENLGDHVMQIIENRKTVSSLLNDFALFSKIESLSYIIHPLVINGDLIGSLIIYSQVNIDENDKKIGDFCAMFLENYLE